MGRFDTLKVKKFGLVLYKPTTNAACYHPGDKVSGFLVVNTVDDIPVRSLRVKLTGKEYVCGSQVCNADDGAAWAMEGSSLSGVRQFTWAKKACFLSEVCTITGDSLLHPSGQVGRMLAADYTIPFVFLLPSGALPSSGVVLRAAENRSGPSAPVVLVRYYLKAWLQLPKAREEVAYVELNVRALVPAMQLLKRGPTGNASPLQAAHSGCCGCGSNGVTSVVLRADKDLVSLDRDDEIHVDVRVDNRKSDVSVRRIRWDLRQRAAVRKTGVAVVTCVASGTVNEEVDDGKQRVVSLVVSARAAEPLTAESHGSPSLQSVSDACVEPANAHRLPTGTGLLFNCSWDVVITIEFGGFGAEDFSAGFDVAVVSGCDDTSRCPPLVFHKAVHQSLEKASYHEFAYKLPPSLSKFAAGVIALLPSTGRPPPMTLAMQIEAEAEAKRLLPELTGPVEREITLLD